MLVVCYEVERERESFLIMNISKGSLNRRGSGLGGLLWGLRGLGGLGRSATAHSSLRSLIKFVHFVHSIQFIARVVIGLAKLIKVYRV